MYFFRKELLKTGFFTIFLLLSCSIECLSALTHDQLIHYYNRREYSTVIAALKTKKNVKLDSLTRYLLFKSLVKTGELDKAEKELIQLEKNKNWTMKSLVLSEKLNLFNVEKNKNKLIDLIGNWPESQNTEFLRNRIANIITTFDSDSASHFQFAEALQSLLDRAPELGEDPKILRKYLALLNTNSKRRRKIIAALWIYTDNLEVDGTSIADFSFIKRNIKKYKEIIPLHFKNQLKIRNYNYINKEISTYMTPLRSLDQDKFIELSQIYFTSMIRKRQYSHLIKLISSNKGRQYFGLTPTAALKMEFGLWLKKGHSQKAIRIMNRLQKSQDAAELSHIYLDLADFFFERDKFQQSLSYYEKVNANQLWAEALEGMKWNMFVAYNKLNRRQKLKRISDWADNFGFEHPGDAAKFCYWGCKLKLYNRRDPIVCFQRYPLTYYGIKSLYLNNRSAEYRLKGFNSAQKNKLRNISSNGKKILRLASLFYQIKEPELADHLIIEYMRKKADIDFYSRLADLLLRHHRYYLLQMLGYEHFGEELVENGREADLLLPYLYPAGFKQHVDKLSRRYKVPNTLVFAVIREESHFRPEALSEAGAVGLMQLMPKTAVYVGKTIRKKISVDKLTDPETNMQLGTAYLRRLLRRYKGNFHHTLAAYNGGATNVKRWRRKTGIADEDYFVEEITFNETKNYVKRVMRSYYIYQYLYGANL